MWMHGIAAGHNDFIRLIKEMAIKATDVSATSACTGTGDGIVYGASSTPSSVAEVWRLTCTDDGSFIITGACSPDITGSYAKTGVNDGKPSYDDGTNACWWSIADGVWYNTIIANIGTPPTNGFRLDKVLAEGSWESMGSATGVPVSVGNSLPTFSVVGGTTGAKPDAVQEHPYGGDLVSFTILKGTTFYDVGDYFDITIIASSPLWVVDRYDDTGTNYELIMHGQGGGSDSIYIGFQGVTDGSNYYNVKLGGFTGYVAENTFDTQPGIETQLRYFCLINTSFDFHIWMNARRLMGQATIGSNQSCFYLGWLKPHASPSQITYPMCVGGTTSYEDGLLANEIDSHNAFWRIDTTNPGNNGLTFYDETFWAEFKAEDSWPINAGYSYYMETDINGNYPMWPAKVRKISTHKNYGDFEGVYIPSTNNGQLTLNDVLTTNIRAFLCNQNLMRSGVRNIVAYDLY